MLAGTKLNYVFVAVTESGPKTAPGQSLLGEIVAPPCGNEILSVKSDLSGIGTTSNNRWNFTMDYTGGWNRTTVISDLKNVGSPLKSSSPFCPVIG